MMAGIAVIVGNIVVANDVPRLEYGVPFATIGHRVAMRIENPMGPLGAALDTALHDAAMDVTLRLTDTHRGEDLEVGFAAGPVGGASGGIPAFDALRDCRKPLIAAIDGYCVAAGFEISLLCDIRVATVQSQFGLPEPRRGLLAGTGLHYLSRIVPLGEAMLMQLTGSFISAERAHQIGLVQRLAPDRKALMDEANAIADDILLGAPLAVQAIKRVVRIARNLPPEYSEHFAAPIEEVVYASEDRLEGPRAFAEKRAPEWKGR